MRFQFQRLRPMNLSMNLSHERLELLRERQRVVVIVILPVLPLLRTAVLQPEDRARGVRREELLERDDVAGRRGALDGALVADGLLIQAAFNAIVVGVLGDLYGLQKLRVHLHPSVEGGRTDIEELSHFGVGSSHVAELNGLIDELRLIGCRSSNGPRCERCGFVDLFTAGDGVSAGLVVFGLGLGFGIGLLLALPLVGTLLVANIALGVLMVIPVSLVKTEANGNFELQATMVFKDSLFKSAVTVKPDGIVSLHNEELLIEDMPVLDDTFGQ